MKPFEYWFGYTDNYTTTYWTVDGTIEQQDDHFLHCVLLADSAAEALSWANHLAQDYLKLDEVFSIRAGWLEEIVPEIISDLPHAPTDWMLVSKAISQTSPAPPYFEGYATDGTKSLERTLHALIYANTHEDAAELWENFLKKNYPHLQNDYVDLWYTPIAKTGERFEWE